MPENKKTYLGDGVYIRYYDDRYVNLTTDDCGFVHSVFVPLKALRDYLAVHGAHRPEPKEATDEG